MCGIAGVLGLAGQPADPDDLRAMAAALAHRGPDDVGTLRDGPLGFAHRRLAILDLTSAGRQPLANEDGSVHVVYNGQLFDFAGVRARLEASGHRFRSRTDTEVLVHLYEERGEDLVQELEGMFAFALWDARRRRLLLARDRLGIKPLYYTVQDGRLAFASELGALLALPWVRRDLDRTAVAEYLYLSSVPGGRCIIEGVRKVAAGERVIVENGTVRRDTYWQPPPVTAVETSFEEAVAGLDAQLAATVRSHLIADVPVGTFLSGGLDSAAVTLHAARASGAPVHTFAVRFEGQPRFDEGPAARETARALGTTHHELTIGPPEATSILEMVHLAGEPFAIASAVPLLHLSRFAREHVKVVLTGDGADEILAGYPWRHEPERGRGARPVAMLRRVALTGVRSLRGARGGDPGLIGQISGRIRRLGQPDENYAEIVSAFTPEELGALVNPEALDTDAAWSAHPVRRAYTGESPGDEVNRRLRVDLRTSLADEMLTKVDRMTMAAGLEARVPFLDRRLVEWALSVPGRHKVAGGVGKRVLRAALAPVLPDAARRPKHGFDPPLGAWLRGPLRELMLDALSPSALGARGFFRAKAVERLLRAHLDGRGDYSRKLFTLMALELWTRSNSFAAPAPAFAGSDESRLSAGSRG